MMDEKIEMLAELEELKTEIAEAHFHLSKYVDKEHWGLSGRIEGLIGMILRYRQDGKLDELLDKIQAEYQKQYEGWTAKDWITEESLKHEQRNYSR